MPDIQTVVKDSIESTGRYPFLFIGSGLSRRYMGTPGWIGLLQGICNDVLGDEFAYARFLARARSKVSNGESLAELPLVATLMEDPVNQVLLSGEQFESFRSAHRDALLAGTSALRMYVSDVFRDYAFKPNEESSLLMEAGLAKVDGVITTNYDSLCEGLFPSFKPYIGEKSLLFSNPAFAQEIFQIHGAISDPDSLVLTESDYARFADREKYLAAKLLAIFVEHPVVFLGYSLIDPNIRSILGSIARCVGPEGMEILKGRLIFVQYERGNMGEIGSQIMTVDGQSLTMTCVTLDDFSPVYRGIASARKLYSPRVLRELKNSIYSIVEKLDAKSQVTVASFDRTLSSLGEDDRVIIGFGHAEAGFGRSIRSVDLFRDVVLDDMRLPVGLVVSEYLDELLNHNSQSIPVFKYLRAANVSPQDAAEIGPHLADYVKKHVNVASFRSSSRQCSCKRYREEHGTLSVAKLIEDEGADRAFQFVDYLEETEIDVDDLGAYLASMFHDEDECISLHMLLEDTYKSAFKRSIRVYDFMRYGYGKPSGLC